jgi:hypothetical protein
MQRNFLLVFFSFVLLGGCLSKPREINGNVFITTNSGESLRLGLVPILLFDDEIVKATVKQAKDSLATEFQELNAKLAQIQKVKIEKKRELQIIFEECQKKKDILFDLERRRPRNPKYYQTPNTDVFTTRDIISEPFNINPQTPKQPLHQVVEQKERQAEEVYDMMAKQWRKEYDLIKEHADEAQKKADKSDKEHSAIIEECESLLKELQRWNEYSQERLFDMLPQPIASTKTDADGSFRIRNIQKGRHAIAAFSTRTDLTKTEKYFWFIYLPQESKPDERISLNNDNLLSVKNTNSVVQIPIISN